MFWDELGEGHIAEAGVDYGLDGFLMRAGYYGDASPETSVEAEYSNGDTHVSVETSFGEFVDFYENGGALAGFVEFQEDIEDCLKIFGIEYEEGGSVSFIPDSRSARYMIEGESSKTDDYENVIVLVEGDGDLESLMRRTKDVYLESYMS